MDSHESVNDWLLAAAINVEFEGDHTLPLAGRLRAEIANELGKRGMNASFRERFAAMVTISIAVILTEEQEERLTEIARQLARQTYLAHSELGFNDDAIAYLGRHVKIELEKV